MHQVELFKMFMQTQMWIWKRINLKTKKEEICQVQGALRELPMGIYGYVFPEESFDEVMTMLNKGGTETLGKVTTAMIRKIIGRGIEKIPEYKEIPTNKYVERRGVSIYLIGIKYDKRAESEAWGYQQEML